jgi:hypothetical protein
MQKEQKQTHHGGTGEQDTELGSKGSKSTPTGATTEDTQVRNPSGDDISDAVDGDEGSGRTV